MGKLRIRKKDEKNSAGLHDDTIDQSKGED